jgi:hypothetical protein
MVASMVRREASLGTRRAPARAVELRMLEGAGARSLVWIVEDEPAASSLAVELCDSRGLAAVVFPDPLPYLAALRADPHLPGRPPRRGAEGPVLHRGDEGGVRGVDDLVHARNCKERRASAS